MEKKINNINDRANESQREDQCVILKSYDITLKWIVKEEVDAIEIECNRRAEKRGACTSGKKDKK